MKLTVVVLLAILIQGTQPQSEVPCPELENIEHGSFTLGHSWYNYWPYAQYSCDRGYEMRGHSIYCDISRWEWDGTAPTCVESSVDCGHPGNVTNGTVDVSEGTKLGAVAQYTCDEGFIHIGTRSRKCRSDGRWSETTPTCTTTEANVDCGHPGNIQYGTVNVSEGNKLYAKIHYTCDGGYTLIGWPYRKCGRYGWSGIEPSCVVDCGHPRNIANGTVHGYSHDEEWIHYSCDYRGFVLNGSAWRRCQSNGTWSGNEPTCEAMKKCPREGINYGWVRVYGRSFYYGGISASYNCNRGHTLRGQSRRNCDLLTGEWKQPAPTCEKFDCGHPGNVTNGTVDVSEGTKLDATAQYTCDEGFIHIGTRSRTCGSDGRWSGTTPTCVVPKTCPQPDIEHGSVEVTRFSTIYFARYTCDVGYERNGLSNRFCNHLTGEWKGTAPTCEESNVDCGHPGNIQYGTVNVSEGTKLYARIYYTCDRGYTLIGSSYRTCSSRGAWSGWEPTCKVQILCPEPEDIEHGSVRVTQYSTTYYVRYTCDAGYERNGLSYRNCDLLTGEWDRTAPTCEESNVDCGHPGNIQYGTVNVSEGTKVHAEIYYTCDRGYRLNGPSHRTCNSYGEWSGREPACEDCGHPGNITNGRVILGDGTKIDSTVYYKCDEGYRLNGWSYRICTQYGWSGWEPSCVLDCGHPGNITNGNVNGYESTHGHRILYICDKGYILNGSLWRTCQSNGAWSGVKPTCELIKVCPNPEDIDQGSVRMVYRIGLSFKAIYASYSCDRGHALRGQSRRNCDLLTGKWEEPAPTCEESSVDCGRPRNVTNGTVVVIEGTEVNSRIYYTCDRGYRLDGPSSRTCRSNGAWSGWETTCEDCGHPGNITNGKVILDNGSMIDPTVFYKCDEGYRLNGPSYRICGQRGWSGREPSCMMDCGHPGNITNGAVRVYESPYRKSIHYRCDVGYTLNGLTRRICQFSRTWSGNEPTCEVMKKCPKPEDIEHGSVRVVDSIRYFHQLYYARYSCDRGHALRGQRTRNCDLLTGEWEGPAPTCEESSVDCGHPGNVTNGTVDVSEGTNPRATARYTCDEGFILNGSRSRTCGSDGRWSGTTPTCEAIKTCPQLDIEHGSVKVALVYTSYIAGYSCDVGYALRGSYRKCDLLTGEWDGTAPTCEESYLDCGHPGNIQYGTVNVSEGTKLHAKVYYTCDKGYRLYGLWLHRHCQSEGTWSGEEPSCGVAVCGHPGNITNGKVAFYGGAMIGHGIYYSCDEGYILNGISTRSCLIGGSWSGSQPTCEAIKKCPNPEGIDHGSVDVEDLSKELYARYSCDRDHALRGQTWRICDLFTGEWEGPAPTCESNVDCGHPENIQNGTVDVSGGTKLDATVQYSCDEGFSRSGSSTRTCQSDGRWSGTTPTCEAIDCKHPGEISNGRVDVSRGTKLGARVRYSCNRGYKLKGPSTRKCKTTGRWNKRTPTCKKQN